MANPYLFLDFETDGLDTQTCVPTQLAMIYYDIDTRAEVARHDMFIQPPNGHQLNTNVLAKTGVTLADAAEGLPQKEVVKLIQSFIRDANGGKMSVGAKPIIVAHNAPFDVSWMDYLFTRADEPLDKYFKVQNGILTYLCTMEMFRSFTSDPKLKYGDSVNLGSMCNYFNVSLLNAHGALADTEATLACWEAMTSRSTPVESEAKATERITKKRNFFQI